MRAHGAVEVAKTIIEVADMAWMALEKTHHHQQQNLATMPVAAKTIITLK